MINNLLIKQTSYRWQNLKSRLQNSQHPSAALFILTAEMNYYYYMDDGILSTWDLDFIACTTYMVVVTTYLVRYILSTHFFYDVTIC